ncbi:hypothetical protein M413DRAFT_268219 [Hebeloma cylindrosporum]|uniref:F-box domain-containing protein n=1 Tax=Hebeloma cylindrosporum TaxID=76867 RepID=A0A0C3CT04_HEBCY|nr:hypothetical protein M413DRAFT_268219 [Hebeloma cylindrosporum h7]
MLPPELLRPIVYYLCAEKDRRSLYALSLTSKILSSEGERLLYRKITLANEGLHNKFLTTIVGSQQKALLVHSYSQDGPDFAAKRRLWSLLAQSLKGMHNLIHLSFRPSFLAGEPEQMRRWVFQLSSLDCRGGQALGQVLFQFLSTQPRLRRLGVDWATSRPIPVTPSTCPALEMVRGNLGIIEILLPGRHVTSLAWIPHPLDPFGHTVDHLAPSLHNLKALSFGGPTSRPSLNLFVCHLQSLEVLKLVDAEDVELRLLQGIPNLRILILLSEFNRRDYSGVPPIDWAPVAENIFLTCSAMEYMEISTHRKNYERWVPGVGYAEPTPKSFQEVHSWWQVQIPDSKI